MIIIPDFIDGKILDEYPRPQCRRNSFISLNGKWEYAITDTPECKQYQGEILVPYSPESPLSQVNRQLYPDQFLHYKKTFTLPLGFNRGRVLLHFGACDQVCKVFLNGYLLGGHEGGYLPFDFDITPYLRDKDNVLTLVVQDDASSDVYGRGKQNYKNGGIWYTAISGIWQTVWLESVPLDYIKGVELTPDYSNKKLYVHVHKDGISECGITVLDGDNVMARGVTIGGDAVLNVEKCKPWTCDDPQLYTVIIRYNGDKVESYFGLRKFAKEKRGRFHLFALNDTPVLLNGLLDQGYFGKGIYTPESNRQMYERLSLVKSLGYNLLRKHIKVESALWYYYCDCLGLLVMQDMVNGGKKYKQRRIWLGPFIKLHINDKNYRSVGRDNPLSRKQYFLESEGMMDFLHNTVSVCTYVPFNECWGQFDAPEVCERFRKKDPTRLYDHASGWVDKKAGDFFSRHIYFKKVKLKNDFNRILALTEFGGYSYCNSLEGKKFGYGAKKSEAEFIKAIEKVYLNEVLPAVENSGLSVIVYTQLTDVEEEVNGILNEDGKLKTEAQRLQEINQKLYRAFQLKYQE